MSDFTDLVDRYLAIWNEPDTDTRGKAVAELWTANGSYTDPLAAVTGHDGIAAVIAAARDMFPDHMFQPYGTVDGHHDIVRFGWELVPNGGAASVVVGFDVAVLAPDGRIHAIYGFLDKAPTG